MGTLDEVRSSFGEDFFTVKRERSTGHTWHELCVCGHLDKHHGPSIGGTYRVVPETTRIVRGIEWRVLTVFGGCVGAVRSRGFEEATETGDQDHHVLTNRINPTCPCDRFRAVAKVDRPNRFFCQRLTDRDDPARHPFMVGIRAFTTHLSKRRRAIDNPAWVPEEFDRRFVWLDGARVCTGAARCTAKPDDVWPVFVDGDRSELRCSIHRSHR